MQWPARLWQRLRAFGMPSLLLVMVAVVHYGGDPIGGLYADLGDPGRALRAANAWASVMRAVEASLLYLAVWWLFPWKPIVARLAAATACAWGVFESASIAICRLHFDMTHPPPSPPLYRGMCDAATGFPVYMLTVCAVLLVAIIPRTKGPAT
jgi:hypothetical protein